MRLGWLVSALAGLILLHSSLGNAEIIQKRATHAELAQKNLNHSLERARRLSAGRPNDPAAAQGVVELLLMRLQFYRNYADLDELATLCKPWSNDARAEAQFLCADVDAARHDFSSALERLSRAANRGGHCSAIQKRIAAIGATLQVDLGGALHKSASINESAMSYTSGVLAAAQATAQGDKKAAVDYYTTAVTSYNDVSPYPIAWAWYQVAELLKDTDPEAAIDYYHESLKYLPDYIAPRVELAAVQIDQGDNQSALQNLNIAMQASDDPDIHALISAALEPDSEDSEAKASLERAEREFAELLQRHPYAFADHAAEVYLHTNKQKAVELQEILDTQKRAVANTLKNWDIENCKISEGKL